MCVCVFDGAIKVIHFRILIKHEKSELVLRKERVLNILVIPQTGTQGTDRSVGPWKVRLIKSLLLTSQWFKKKPFH